VAVAFATAVLALLGVAAAAALCAGALGLSAVRAARVPREADGVRAAAVVTPATPLPERYRLAGVWSHGDEAEPFLYHPEGIDLAPDGTIYLAELGNHRVSAWDLDGDPVGRWGTRGVGPGEFDAPEDLAVDAARRTLYVADTGNRRVQVLDSKTGAHLATWEQVGRPRGVAVAPDGRVFVADAEGHQVLVLDPAGQRLAAWGGLGRGPGQLDTPLGLTFGHDGLLYVADSGNLRVQWLDETGAAAGQLDLSGASGPGGAPQDVGIDDDGDLFVAVERGVLRFRNRSSYAETIPPQFEADAPGCPIPGRCRRPLPIANNHEGVRRLALRPGVGLAFSFAPALRFRDSAFVFPERADSHVIPKTGAAPHARRLYDPHRIATGADPQYAHVLDTSGLLRVYQSDGRWYSGRQTFPGGPGTDVAVDTGTAFANYVLTGNQVQATTLLCLSGCPPGEVEVLDGAMRARRDRTGARVLDEQWWNTAVAQRGLSPPTPFCDRSVRPISPLARSQAVLDTGYQRAVLRSGLDSANCCDTVCESLAVTSTLLGSIQLNPPSAPFRAYRDLAFDAQGNLAVLARDGALVRYSDRGRSLGEIALHGLDGRTAEALALTAQGESLTLSGDGWLWKHGPDGLPLAAWNVEAEAGPGRYEDVAVGPDGRVLVPDGAGDRILVFARAPDPPTEPVPAPGEGGCRFEPRKSADPGRLALGETTGVSLRLSGDCGSRHAMLDVVVVVDASCQMAGARLTAAREAGLRLVEAMTQEADRLAVVTFSDVAGGARLLAPLTDDEAALRAAFAGLDTDCLPPQLFPERSFDGRPSDGLRAGREALFGPRGRPGAGKVLVLVSPSNFDRDSVHRRIGRLPSPRVTDREHIMWEARRLWAAGARVHTVALAEDPRAPGPAPADTPPPPIPTPTPDLNTTHPPDRGLLASAAYPADAFHDTDDPSALPAVLAELGEDLSARLLFRDLEVTDRIPANMRLVPGSIEPPAEILPDGSLRWSLGEIGLGGPPELRYRLEPLDAGRWPTNIEAVADYVDGLGVGGRLVFPVPEVDVIAPTPSATATDEPSPTPRPSETPTAAPSATATPSASPSDEPPTPSPTATTPEPPAATATNRATPIPLPIHLPILHLQPGCVPSALPVDVVLVLDTSSSMAGAKLDAALRSARSFVALLDLPHDRAAVVTFDSQARTAQPLTGDRQRLDAALTRQPTALGTRIDRGLTQALGELLGPRRRSAADPVIVLLTDGRPQGGSEADTATAARMARDLGTLVYAIGLGSDVDPRTLTDIAGRTDRVFVAPGPADLTAIYRDIARVIPCR
jgi:Mg-chelatase subunit ChlD/sugar lactone lactonase YvrE